MALSSSLDSLENLPALFKEGLNLYNNLGRSDEPTNSPSIQSNVKRCIKIFERTTNLVSLAEIFSSNEGIEELATTNIQYLLLPALLGSLTLKLTSGDRKEIVDIAEIYFKDFLRRTNNYNLSNYKFKEETQEEALRNANLTEFEKLAHSVNVRANKIQRFKEQKELQAMLEILKENLNNEHVDDEIKRKYYLTLVKSFIHEAVDELNSIDMEKPILEHMATLKKDDSPQPKRPAPAPLKPVIITKDLIQKAVYGAGYPSLPTMTVQEFYDKRVKDGVFPDPNKPKKGPMSLQEASLAGLSLDDGKEDEIEKLESKLEVDDEEYLKMQRQRDDFKDDHRRGWGNRSNRS
ncbi:hypothetical protein WA026_010609 [Henosepilachna vigintioctopunctata]|uniref:Immunoglobulin-binding protein 1 n=1 Tax=Henosepilachna vigintioctopunctata TaxID=420089 RepID=A0AAW1VAQ8_9CUCU